MSRGSREDGGLSITTQMNRILNQPGFISITMGSERLRNMFQERFAKFDPSKLAPFAHACALGDYSAVKQAVDSGAAPDLTTTQTPFQLGFISLTVICAKWVRPYAPGSPPLRHADVLTCLIDAGAPIDMTDIVGHTGLHHACTPPNAPFEIAKLLLDRGANVNAQTRYGEVPLFFPFQGGDVKLVDLLMVHGADMDVADANGDTPRSICLTFGAEITAAVQRWERKRRGEVAPLEEKRCENCKVKRGGLKLCARCHVVWYCSTECQRAHWKTHKPDCHPFDAATTVTLKPTYTGPGGTTMSGTISRADFARQAFGLATRATQAVRPGLPKHAEADNKWMVIKIQIPVSPFSDTPVGGGSNSPFAALLIYNKKRDFVCNVTRSSNPSAYDAIVQIVRSRGVGGAKAYFAAELKSPDELVVKTSEVLAEQPF